MEEDREAGARENRGGRGREARERGAGSGIYMGAGSGSRNKEGDSLFFITRYYSVKNTYLAKFRKSKIIIKARKPTYFGAV